MSQGVLLEEVMEFKDRLRQAKKKIIVLKLQRAASQSKRDNQIAHSMYVYLYVLGFV